MNPTNLTNKQHKVSDEVTNKIGSMNVLEEIIMILQGYPIPQNLN